MISGSTRPSKRRAALLGTTAIVASLAFLAQVAPAFAANKIWTGAADSDFGNGANWIGGAPTAADIAVFDSTAGGTNAAVFFNAPITVGGLQFSGGYSGSVSGTADITLTGGLTNSGSTISLQSAIMGAGAFVTTSGSLRLDGSANTYTGATTIGVGTLFLTGGAQISASSQVNLNNAAAVFDISTNGSTTITTLAGVANSHVELGASQLVVSNASTTYGGIIQGAGGGVTLNGGTLTLSGANTFSGDFTLNGGTVSAGNNDALGTGRLLVQSGTLDIQNGVTLANMAILSNNLTINTALGTPLEYAEYSGEILEAGGPFGIIKTGEGRLILSGANNYSGATEIREGRLVATDHASIPNASDVVIASRATLEVSGASVAMVGSLSGAGDIEIGSGAMLATGLNGGTHTFSGRISGDGDFSLRESGIQILTGTGSSIGGILEICACASGQLIIRGGSFTAGGPLELFGGSFTVDGAGSSVTVAGVFGQTPTVAALTVSGGATLTSEDSLLDAVNGGIDPASITATVTGAGSKWTINGGFGLQLGDVSGDAPVSVSAAAGGTIEVARIEINANATLNLGLGAGAGTIDTPLIANGGRIVADFTDSATLAADISGAGTLTKQGSGTLTLTGANSYTGTTFLNGGILSVAADANLGDPTGALTFDGGVLQVTGTGFSQTGRTITLGAGGGGFDIVEAAHTFTLTQGLSGSGGLSKTGAGTLVMAGLQSYSGATNVVQGTLRAGAAGVFSSSSAFTIAAGARLDLASLDQGIGSLAGLGAVELGSARLSVGADGSSTSFAGAISGTGSLVKQGAGTLTLTGTNSYGGGTTISGGTLIGNTTSLQGAITNNAVLVFDQAAAGTFAGGIFGTGSLVKQGAGALTLTGTSFYSGSTTIGAGTLIANTASLQGPILNNAALVFDQAATGAFTGAISGTGSLTKQGAGTLTLTGANSYSGGTTIGAGTLVGHTTSLQGPILNNATLVFDQPMDGIFASVISGTGTLVKQGTGALTLTGTSTLSGPTTVAAGLLTVNGSLANSVVTLNGGTLGGSGTVGGIVVNGGRIAPGNSIGTLNVAGNVGFSAGTTYQVELNSSGASDRIVATGTATLNGGQVQVLAANGTYAQSTRYSILTAQGGVSGQFASVTSDLAFLTPSLSYGGNEVVLTMARNQVAFPAVAITRNQAGASYAAEALGTGNPIYDRLLGTNSEQARAGFDALSGEAHAQAVSVAVEDSHLIRESILNRLRAPFGAPAAGGSVEGAFTADLPGRKSVTAMPAPMFDPGRFTVWGEAIGAKGMTDRDGNAASLHRSGGGMLLGMEMNSDPVGAAQWRLGVAGGYTQTDFDIDARSAKGELSSAHGAIYGGTRFGAVSFRTGAAYAWSETDIKRQVSLPGFTDNLRLDGRSATAQAFAEIGYGLTLGSVALEPFAQIAAISIRTDRAAEQGGAAALVVLGRDQRLGFTTLGLRAEAQLGALPLIARGMLGWRHAFGDTTPAADLAFVAGATPFRSYAAPLARDALLAEAGLAWKASRSTTLGISYGAALSDKARDQALKGRIDIAF